MIGLMKNTETRLMYARFINLIHVHHEKEGKAKKAKELDLCWIRISKRTDSQSFLNLSYNWFAGLSFASTVLEIEVPIILYI